MGKDTKTLLKRARSKYLSKGLALKLYEENEDSPLRKAYLSTLYCADILTQSGQKLTAAYCNQRWCAVCGRIRTGKAINGYLPQLKGFTDSYFVTLTKKTVTAPELPRSIQIMEDTWRALIQGKTGRRRKCRGLRKAECTIRPDGQYHYHFHLLIDGRENAEWIMAEWLRRMGEQADRKAQDIRKADQNSYVELFKYATKLLATQKDTSRGLLPLRGLDVIYQALRGKRLFQPFGGLRRVSEEVEGLRSEDYDFLTDEEQLWIWRRCDWINQAGELLTNYRPSEQFEKLFEEAKILAET